MSNNLSILPPSAERPGPEDRSPGQQNPRREPGPAPEPDVSTAADPGQRLVIEEGVDGQLVYTVIDRASGAVLARTSREEVSRMGQRPDYAAGALIRAKA